MSNSTTNEPLCISDRSKRLELTSPAVTDDACDSDASLPVLCDITNDHFPSIDRPNNHRAIVNVGLNDWLNKRTFANDSVKHRASAISLSREAMVRGPVQVEAA